MPVTEAPPAMRIAFNATALLSPRTGLGQYAWELATRMRADPALDPRFFYAMGWSREVRDESLPAARRLIPWLRQYVPGSYALRRLLQTWRFTQGVRGGVFDVYHEPNFLPLPFDGPTVTTVHDLSWLRFPQAHPAQRVRAMNQHFETGLRRSHLVLTDSDFVRREVIDTFGLAPERVQAIGLGASAVFRPMSPTQTAPTLEPLGLAHGGFLLAVGTLEPRKNLVTALRAYAGLAPALRDRVPLVLAGLKGWHTEALEREMSPLQASGHLRLTGYLPRADLARLVAAATALVYPSFYEGFGLPPLEAMACGVPSIVANGSSLPEVVGDTGIQVDAYDIDGLRTALQRMVEDQPLRDAMGAQALQRAGMFSWDLCAKQTAQAYRQAIELASA